MRLFVKNRIAIKYINFYMKDGDKQDSFYDEAKSRYCVDFYKYLMKNGKVESEKIKIFKGCFDMPHVYENSKHVHPDDIPYLVFGGPK